MHNMIYSLTILYHWKTTAFSYSHSPHIRILKKQRVCIFKFWDWKNLLSFPPPSRFMVKKLEKESRRGHRKAWTPYHESKKKTTRFDRPTHTHIHIPHTRTRTLTQLSPSLFVFFPIPHFNLSSSLSFSPIPCLSFMIFFTLFIHGKSQVNLTSSFGLASLQAPPHFPLSSL